MTRLSNSDNHKITRAAQAQNADSHHHPTEKMQQLDELKDHIYGDILEVFGGQGNLTAYYEKLGKVTSLTKETTGDSFNYIYKLRSENKMYDVIDIDSYGYPSKFFPLVF